MEEGGAKKFTLLEDNYGSLHYPDYDSFNYTKPSKLTQKVKYRVPIKEAIENTLALNHVNASPVINEKLFPKCEHDLNVSNSQKLENSNVKCDGTFPENNNKK